MRALFVSSLSGILGLSVSLSASASFCDHDSNHIDSPGWDELSASYSSTESSHSQSHGGNRSRTRTLELDDFFVTVDKDRDYGWPQVAGDESLVYLPNDMSVETRKRYESETFTTSMTVLPSTEGFQFDTLKFLEYGDYKYRGSDDAKPSEFEFSASLFISDYNDPFKFDHFSLEASIEVDESTGFETWELRGEFDISDYADGFFLVLQNTISLDPGKGAKSLYAQKKGVVLGFEGGTTVVPVPAAAWLFGSAVLGLVTARRRLN